MLSPCVSCAFQLILERPRWPQARSRDPPPGMSDPPPRRSRRKASAQRARALAFMRARLADVPVRVRQRKFVCSKVRIARRALLTAVARPHQVQVGAGRPFLGFRAPALHRGRGRVRREAWRTRACCLFLSTPSPGVWAALELATVPCPLGLPRP